MPHNCGSRSKLRCCPVVLAVLGLGVDGATKECSAGLCAAGTLSADVKWCCESSCGKCGGVGCGSKRNGPGPGRCCPARWNDSAPSGVPVCEPKHPVHCKMPQAVSTCVQKVVGGKVGGQHSHKVAADRSCSCRSPFSRAYRGSCLPSFMVIGSQKAATSKLRWYLSRHPEIEIPKEEAFHSGPKAVTAWDTKADPLLLSNYLAQFNDVCNTTSITGLKMPDYIVMSTLTIEHFHKENPGMRIIITLREPVARMYSYFSMQLRFGWSPINHMGKNPCMQQQLRAILKEKEARAQRGAALASNRIIDSLPVFSLVQSCLNEPGRATPNTCTFDAHPQPCASIGEIVKLNFTSEEIMVTNLKCVRPCYASNASGVGPEAEEEIWHNEKLPECKNIYFTPLVHSMYALHIRRWLRIFDREAMLLLRFDDLVLHPLEVLQKVAHFLKVSSFAANFKYEVGRENFTTIERLLQSGAVTRSSVKMLQAFFAPHDEALHKMFPGEQFY